MAAASLLTDESCHMGSQGIKLRQLPRKQAEILEISESMVKFPGKINVLVKSQVELFCIRVGNNNANTVWKIHPWLCHDLKPHTWWCDSQRKFSVDR